MQKHALCSGSAYGGNRHMTKLLLVMRLTFFFLTAAFLNVSAKSVSQNVSFTGKDVPIEKVFAAVEQQTGYVFLYTEPALNGVKPVTINADHLALELFLMQVLKNQPLDFTIKSKTIVISHKTLPGLMPDQQIRDILLYNDIHGKVVDNEGRPLIGATVVVKGTSKGTITEADGSFVLRNAESSDILVVTYLGFKAYETKIATSGRLIMVLEPATDPLDEVQVIAYGNSTKRMNLGDVTTVRAADIEKQPVNNILLALQGRVPGMQLTAVNNSLPGNAPTIKIRGINSIAAGTSPLYILDGIPIPETLPAVNGIITQSALLTINPADIESVEVLKDAEATAIYGSRGANGVILITTKKGKPGKTLFNVNAWTGFGKVPRRVPLMDVHQYNVERREALANDGIVATSLNAADLFAWDTTHVRDYQKLLLGGTAVTSDANLSVSGGDVNTRFLLNGGYHKDGTVLPGGSGADRASLRFSIDHVSPNGKLGVNATAAFVNTALNLPATDLTSSITFAPSYPLYNADGTPNFNAPSGYPLAYLNQPFSNKTNNYNGHIALRYTPVKGLNLKLDAGFNNSITDESQKIPASTLPSTQSSSLNIRNTNGKTWIAEPQADYTVHVRKHTLTLLAGGTWQQTNSVQLGATGIGFTSDALLGNISSATTITTRSNQTFYSYNSAFSRLSYNWNQEYLANVSFRRDGSSRFGPGKRFGNFGAVSAGWIFTENKYIKAALPFLSFGKIRASYGHSGNDQINDYGYIATYNSYFIYQSATLIPANLANPDYRWEENKKLEAALELGLFKDRVLVTAAAFRNRTDNQLINYPVSPQSGYGGYPANFPGLLQNQGLEFEIISKNIVKRYFNWKTSVNFSMSQNKLLSFPNLAQSSYFGQYFVGQPLTVAQAYHFTGLNNKGVPQFEDTDKDGSITSKDRNIVGNNNPLFGGMSNEFGYKQFHFSVFLEYTHINAFNNSITASRVGALGSNPLTQVLDRWQKPGDELITSRPLFTTSAATYNARTYSQSDIFWTNSNIFRLRNMSLSYNLPNTMLKKAGVRNLQVYVLAQNVWVFDKNKYRLDPETGNGGMPPLRMITFGLNCSL